MTAILFQVNAAPCLFIWGAANSVLPGKAVYRLTLYGEIYYRYLGNVR